MKRKLRDSVVVITGASSGISRAAAMNFARRGACLVLAARGQDQLEALASDCRRFGSQAIAVPTDVGNLEAVEVLAKSAIEKFGRIDIWVNNAGVSLFGRFEEVPYEDFRKVIETNLFGYIHGARVVLPLFRKQRYGVLINVSSTIGKAASPLVSAYSISKFGIVGLAESLRQELLDVRNIHVCTVLPASVDTPLFQHAANYTGRAVKPLNPIYPAEDVAQQIVKLAVQPKREVYVGEAGFLMGMMRRLAPGLTERTLARQVFKDHFTDASVEPYEGNLYAPKSRWSGVSGQWLEGSPRDSGNRFLLLALPWISAGLAAWMLYKSNNLSMRGLTASATDLTENAKQGWSKTRPRLRVLSNDAKDYGDDTVSSVWSKTKPKLGLLSDKAKSAKKALSR